MFIHITTYILHYIKHYTAKSICMWGDQVWGEVSIGLGGAECLEAVTSRATPPPQTCGRFESFGSSTEVNI